MIRNVVNNYKPECALPGCSTRVSYHNAKGLSAKWKMFCTAHRTTRKFEVDNWKLKQGCSNVDAHHGFVCTATIFGAEQLDVNHIDGDRYNSNSNNLEVLCRNCHASVTVNNGHHLNRYSNEVPLDPSNWEISK
jgi:hypothetical protein